MPKLTESQIEDFAIELLESLGYRYIYGPDIAPDNDQDATVFADLQRSSYESPILEPVLRRSIDRINPNIPESARQEALHKVLSLYSPDLTTANKTFHKFLTEGINVHYYKEGQERGDYVWLIDFDNPSNNEFYVINQFTVKHDRLTHRPDIVLFVNGLPLVVIELKNAADENADIMSAFRQLQTYKQNIPQLFYYNEILAISDGHEARAGSLSAGFNRFMRWRLRKGDELEKYKNQLEVLINGMFNKDTLLDLVKNFIVFKEEKQQDTSGQTTVKITKILAAYHQYYAVNKAVESTLKAIQDKSHKAGVIWHTQGSGKSFSMVFLAGKLIRVLDNPTIVVITDRNDLDDQLFKTFYASRSLLRQEPKQADSRDGLKQLLKVASGGVVFTTIQKFFPENSNVYERLSDRENIIVIADEAHRTQYGFKAKTNRQTGDISYGFAKYMRDALPNATFIGFTGTPVELSDRNTPAVFGNYIDIYDVARAIEDGATVPIYYESRLVQVELTDEGRELLEAFDEELEQYEMDDTMRAKAKWSKLEAIVGSKERIKRIARDIVEHFERRLEVLDGKGMIVAMSRRIAAELYEEIIRLRPHWHSDDLDKGFIKVVMTSSASDGPLVAKHHTTKQERETLANRFKDPDDELKLVIVRDMWLTGFDVPSLHTMYIDKPMKGHTLMQAIARVNRVFKDKTGGLIVDYIGIAKELKEALAFYAQSGGKGDPVLMQEEAIELMKTKLDVVRSIMHGFDYSRYFTAPAGEKLDIILEAQDYVLSTEDLKKRFLDEVTALSRAYSLAIPHPEAMQVKDEIAFFQAVKARLMKIITSQKGKKHITSAELETAIKQVVDQALVSNKVIDIFDAAGLRKPDVSILSDDFLAEVKNMKHKNLAIEVLRRLLNDEIKARTKRNIILNKKLLELVENAIIRYQNQLLSATQVIDELISIAKEVRESGKEAEQLGMTEYEYAFYTAVADNESARELMGKEQLRELAIALYQSVKQNATIDWTIRESARARLRVTVKRLLKRYGYPPDMQKLAIDNVLKQAEEIAEELTA